jgi:hypothetical protein
MIVFQIHVRGIPFGPPECDPPIAADVDRASAFVATGERVKAKARQIHVLGSRRIIECP